MPQVTVYIRESDLEQWKALEKKSEFIHNALNPIYDSDAIKQEILKPKIIKTPQDAVEAVKQLFPDARVVTPLFRDKKNKKL